MAAEHQSQQMIVIDRDGQRGVVRAYHPRQNQYVVEFDNETLLLPSDLLVALGQTYFKTPLSFVEAVRGEATIADSVVIPVLEEELHVGKRVVAKAKVRLRKEVNEREVIVDEPLIEDQVEIERVPVNRAIDKPVRSRVEGDTTIIPIMQEVLMVKKQLMLVEGGTLVGVSAEESQVDRVLAIMNRYGPVDIQRRSSEWRSAGWTGFDAGADDHVADTAMRTNREWDLDRVEGEKAIPVVEEELRVGKREVETGGVRVHSYMEETPVREDVTLRQERVTVDRRPVDRPVDPATVDAFQEGTIEMTETSEEVVVDKSARVVEEVVVGKEVDTHTERVEDTIRRTKVDVENLGERVTGSNWGDYDTRWRSHYDQYYGATGRNYDYYQPGYRYGYTIANDPRNADRDWDLIETDVRRDWEATGQGAWEEFKDSIRHGWNEVKRALR